MNDLSQIPELRALDNPPHLVRIPDQLDVPLTPRAMRIIDTAEFRRLADISQLGLVALVYPGATHSRMEHSLGAYRMALLFLRKLAGQEDFSAICDRRTAEVFLVATLLHDIGHWPFCHPVEDLALENFPTHEQQASEWMQRPGLKKLLRNDWGLEPDDVMRLLVKRPASAAEQIACSMLSGPVDVDKMDYLSRDSLHAGVPYGRNFDPLRLIGSLCLDRAGQRLAISGKGKTAAEMMVFSRYVMFSEVYWHHAVRSATAMFQRAVFGIRDKVDLAALTRSNNGSIASVLADAAGTGDESLLLENLFGNRRVLYKRLWQSGQSGDEELFRKIAHRPYAWLDRFSNCLTRELSGATGVDVGPHQVLTDAPPAGLEVQFRVNVVDARSGQSRPLGEVSPVVHALATRQFDDFVKQVRVFVHPDVKRRLSESPSRWSMEELMHKAAAGCGTA